MKQPLKRGWLKRIAALVVTASLLVSGASVAFANDDAVEPAANAGEPSAASTNAAADITYNSTVSVNDPEDLAGKIAGAADAGQSPRKIVLTADMTLSDPITIPARAEVTITDDGNGDPENVTVSHSNGTKWDIAKVPLGQEQLFTVEKGAALNFKASNNSSLVFDGGASFDALAATNGGKISFSGGTYKGFCSRRGAVALVRGGGSITVNGGTFTGNKANVNGTDMKGGGVFAVDGKSELTINDGTFTQNSADAGEGKTVNGGGVVYANNSTVVVKGGTFSNNTVNTKGRNLGGGAMYVTGADSKLTIKGGKFSDNTVNMGKGDQAFSGGGAIWAQGQITIDGGVAFSQNKFLKATAPNGKVEGWSGGGAIFVYGAGNGGDPNYVVSSMTIIDATFSDNESVGDGGAIFVGWHSEVILMGGQFTNNISHHLGGAIYTEELTTTYMSQAFATANHAGHFGGGLWLCPSGKSFKSKGGNMIAVGNEANEKYDPTNTGTTFVTTGAYNYYKDISPDTGAAGDDFALMSPTKNNISNYYQLSNKGWGDASNTQVVHWWQDGTLTNYTDGLGLNSLAPGGENLGLATAKGSTRYDAANPGTEQGETEFTSENINHVPQGAGWALKATWAQGQTEDSYKANAKVLFTGNEAYYSGGAFGTNGNILFDTPYRVSWTKTSTTDPEVRVAGTTWKLTLKGGDINPEFANDEGKKTPWYNNKFRAQECTATYAGNADPDNDCWKQTAGETTSDNTNDDVWEATVTDNGIFDQDPDDGVISLNNLALGTFTLQETKAPDGYAKSDATYQFTTQKQGLPKFSVVNNSSKAISPFSVVEPNGGTDTSSLINAGNGSDAMPQIGNKPVDASWQKVDSTDNGKALAGSEWTIEKQDDTDKTKWSYVTYSSPTKGNGKAGSSTTGSEADDPTPASWTIDKDATTDTAFHITDCAASTRTIQIPATALPERIRTLRLASSRSEASASLRLPVTIRAMPRRPGLGLAPIV